MVYLLKDYNVLPIFYELGSARLTSDSRSVIDDKLLSYSKLHDETEKSSNASSIEVARKQNNSVMETNVSNWEFYMHK